MTLKFIINELPKTPNAIGKASIWHSVAERKRWRDITARRYYEFIGTTNLPFKKCKITLTRHSAREPDVDNLYSSFKFPLDSLKYNGFIFDDKPSLVKLECKWEKAKQLEGKITIEIESLDETSKDSSQV